MKQSEQEFLDSVKTTLDQQEHQIDELTQAKLSAARHRAVEVGSQSPGLGVSDVLSLRWFDQRAAILAGVTSLAVVAMLVLPPSEPQPEQQALALLDDMGLLAATEELEFYQELDFYLWMDDEEISG